MPKVKRGDTLVEIAFAIAVFALVSIICINLMNSGLNTEQASIEVAMARNEMDAQAEALRYIHNAFTLEREIEEGQQQYRDLWYRLTRDNGSGAFAGMANNPDSVPNLTANSCNEFYDTTGSNDNSIINNRNFIAFIMNTRVVNPNDQTFMPGVTDVNRRINQIVLSTQTYPSAFSATSLNPRVIYSDQPMGVGGATTTDDSSQLYESNYEGNRYVYKAEGIWIIAAKDHTRSSGVVNTRPEFFDFHIRSCWYAPGRTVPSTIGTIIRLYNPEVVEDI